MTYIPDSAAMCGCWHAASEEQRAEHETNRSSMAPNAMRNCPMCRGRGWYWPCSVPGCPHSSSAEHDIPVGMAIIREMLGESRAFLRVRLCEEHEAVFRADREDVRARVEGREPELPTGPDPALELREPHV